MTENPNGARRLRELPRHYPVLFSFLLLAISFGISFFIMWEEHSLSAARYQELATNTFLGFVTGQLAFVLLQMLTLEDKLEKLTQDADAQFASFHHDLTDKGQLLRQVALRNQDQHDSVLNIFRMFYFRGNPAHDTLRQSLLQLVRNMHISDHAIKFESDYLSRGSFENLWRLLIEEQKRRRKQNSPDLIVRAAHSASVKLWTNAQFLTMLTLQEEFIKHGGKVFRLLLHSPNSSEHPKDFLPALTMMRAMGIRVFYLDKRSLVTEHPHDFILARFDHMSYAFSWNTDWNEHGSQGHILGTDIAFGPEEFEVYWHKWMRDIGMVRAQAKIVKGETGNDALTEVPTQEELTIMETLTD